MTEPFGAIDGRPVRRAVLSSDAGVSVAVISLGCIVQSWLVPDRNGTPRETTLGFATLDGYARNPERAFGIIAGRVANRIRDARFTLGGETYALDRNRGPHILHGGREGFGLQVWDLEADGRRARLSLSSPDGAMGFPGALDVVIDIALEGHALTFDMTASPDRPTPVNLAQHSYFALGGDPMAQRLTVPANRVTENDDLVVATGRILPVDGTRWDFRTPRAVGTEPLDINFCLDGPTSTLEGDDFRLTITTDQPGLQAYNSFDMPDVADPGHGGVRYGRFAGVALEAQGWPDAVNNPQFPSIVATPERPYRQTTTLTITPH